LKSRLLRLVGANRPKIIAVFATTRAEAERAVSHARAGANLPIWAYCAEAAIPIEGCARFDSGSGALRRFAKELRGVWVALSIVAWTGPSAGRPAAAAKLFPFTILPFRILVLNEAGDFFAAGAGAIAGHLRRRMRDASLDALRRAGDVAGGLAAWTGSIIYRAAEKTVDAARWIYSLAYRTGERSADAIRLTYSLLYRTGERLADAMRLAYSLLYRTSQRLADAMRLAYSLLYRGAERFADVFGLAYSLLYRGGERLADVFRLVYSLILWSWTWFWTLVRGAAGWTGESILAGLAILARCAPALSRFAVGSLRNRQPFQFGQLAGDAVEIVIPGRAWPRRAVMRALTESSAEFVVFRRGRETASAGPLIRMAKSTGAFAAARQLAHSAWRKRVVIKHPFRQLQEGEVSEVFAPFSSLLVIRRDLFLKLGCPRAFTFGAALMLLFWKASAAGLRSLTVGHDGPVTDEPAMDLEDAELALRVTLSGRLRRLGPRDPDRLRGNVARAPGYANKLRGKPCVLIVSPYLPFPMSHGGAVRIYNLCREMSHEIDFILACFREAGEVVQYAELHEVFREVYIVDADQKCIDAGVPRQVAEYRNSAMSDLIRRFCLGQRVDLVQLEYTQLAEYRDDTGAVPVLLVEHDITFTLHQQLAEFTREIAARHEFQRWQAFEREALQCSNAVWTMSEHDKSVAVTHGARRDRTTVIPNGVDLRRFRPEARGSGALTILFVGSFRHLPNLLAFEALRESIMPEVWRTFPDAVLHVIAGPRHERAVELAGKERLLVADPRIQVRGFVEDVRPAYRDADVVVIPLPVSAGTNIKLMEAMACGRAIVSTAAGCAGLNLVDGRELIVAGLGAPFAAAIVNLLADENARLRMAAEARRTAERRFGWDSIAHQALDFYSGLMPAPLRVKA